MRTRPAYVRAWQSMNSACSWRVPLRPCHDSRVEDTDKATQANNKARTTRPTTEEFKKFLGTGWAEPDDVRTTRAAAAPYAAERRERLSTMFTG